MTRNPHDLLGRPGRTTAAMSMLRGWAEPAAKRVAAMGEIGATVELLAPGGALAVLEYVAELEAEVKRLGAALKPFAEAGQPWLPTDETDTSSVWVSALDSAELVRLSPRSPLTVGHLRAAARAMP